MSTNELSSELSIEVLQASLDAKIGDSFHTLDTDPDVLSQLLADKRSGAARRDNHLSPES